MSDPKLNTPSSSEIQVDKFQSNDFSLLELFFKADAVVMLVMLSLIFLSKAWLQLKHLLYKLILVESQFYQTLKIQKVLIEYLKK